MSDPGYERYREALRQGHLAALRGDHAAAVAGFGEAADLAPDRPLPHVGLATALRELGLNEEALAAFERALRAAPLDEPALRGRAATLMVLGRSADASATLTGLAESLEADGRITEALGLAREALALASSPARFRLVARLAAGARGEAAAGRTPADLGTTAEGVAPVGRATTPGGSPGSESATAEAAGQNGTAPAVAGTGARSGAGPARAARSDRPTAGSSVGVTLVAEADSLADAGRLLEARDRYLLAARSHREGGRPLAALDACYQALAIAPADPDLHLILAELYEERGWVDPAVDKLVLLFRLLDLVGDQAARDRLCRLVVSRFGGEPRLAGLCS